MMKRHDLSIFVAISLVLHALFFAYLLQWVRSAAQARPSYNVIKVSIVQGAPQVKPMAMPGRPAARVKPVVLPKLLTAPPLPQEKKAPILEEETPQTTTPDAADAGESTNVANGPITGTASGQGSPGGVPAVNAVPSDTVNAERAFANARDAYTMELGALLKKYFDDERHYPIIARKRGYEGRVLVRFVIVGNGRAQDIEVVSSSGYYILDRAAVDAIHDLPLPPPPRAMQITVPIVYRLEDER